MTATGCIRDGRVRLYTMNAADWSDRYPVIVKDAARIKGTAIIDAEVVCAGKDGVPDFDRLHGRCRCLRFRSADAQW